MSALLIGVASFGAFALSDYIGTILRRRGGSALFAAGGLLLIAATALLAGHSGTAALIGRLWPLRWLSLLVAAAMLVLLF